MMMWKWTKKWLRITLELLDDFELKSIGIPAGIGQGTGLGLRDRDRDGIGLRHYRLRTSQVQCGGLVHKAYNYLLAKIHL